MKLLCKITSSLVMFAVLSVTGAVVASSENQSESGIISEALALYVRATSMEIDAPERTGLLRRAETLLNGVIEGNPESLEAHRKLMGVYLQLRDYSRAVQTLQSAISLSPDDPKLFIALAILYDHQGAYTYALPMLDRALALDADQQLARDYRASIQQKLERQTLAMESQADPHRGMDGHAR